MMLCLFNFTIPSSVYHLKESRKTFENTVLELCVVPFRVSIFTLQPILLLHVITVDHLVFRLLRLKAFVLKFLSDNT